MDKHSLPIYQAAASVAHALRQNQPPPAEARAILAGQKAEAKEALARYGATRVWRDIDEKEVSDAQLEGQTLVLYKTPLPSEQQAKLSYEYLLGEFNEYLRRKVCAIVLSESDAHVSLWLPEGARLELTDLWQTFITEMTTSEGLTRGFGLVMNSSRLSDRGFSTLETPMVSPAQPAAVAAFYIANIEHVAKRMKGRQGRIEAIVRDLEVELEDKEHDSLQKKLDKEQEMQVKELEKYRSEFGKQFKRSLDEQLFVHKALNDLFEVYEKADTKTQKRLDTQRAKLERGLTFDEETTRALHELYQPDPFMFIDTLKKHSRFGKEWREAAANAKRYSQTAANQLSTQKGDIYAKVVWETCVLLFGQAEVVPLEPLLSSQPIVWGVRDAGDDNKGVCYSCGRPLDDAPSYPSRRLAFESPDQRPQSGGSSRPAELCYTCAALSVLSPVKFAPDTLVIRFGTQGVQERVRHALEQQALNEIGAVAGRYINLSCTEREGDGTLASQKLGSRQYAYAKLASLIPRQVLESLEPQLYQDGAIIPLRPSVLVGTQALMTLYWQGIMDKDPKRGTTVVNVRGLGKAIRLLEQTAFYPACYHLASFSKTLEQPRANIFLLDQMLAHYCALLLVEDIQMASFTRDVQALVALLTPACNQLIAMDNARVRETTGRDMQEQQLKEWREREVAKLIQQVDSQEPTTFAYSSAKTVGGIGYLRRNEFTRFAYLEAERLIKELGLERDDYASIFVERDSVPAIKVTNDLIFATYAHIKDKYDNDYERKRFFYHVKLGLFARFQDAI